MIEKVKVCLIGATAVGKTSLVARYVTSIFSDQYRTTIGVKIETYTIHRDSRAIEMVLWDLSGEDEFQNVSRNYLTGASGYLLVIDGTRLETVGVATMLEARAREALGSVPFVAVLNKSDLVASWEARPSDVDELRNRGWTVVTASAKTGEGVQEAFARLVDAIVERQPWK